MKKFYLLIVLVIIKFNSYSQCTANYSFSGNTDTLFFTNMSTVSNAHFFWHFGDGSGSNDSNPVHVFPDDGDYLVTLYCYDTISLCSNFYESFIHVDKPDTVPCDLLLDAFVNGGTLMTVNQSTNCNGFGINCGAGPGMNYCSGVSLSGGGPNQLWLAWLRSSTYDSIYGARIWEEYYNTVPNYFNPMENYQDCSANFEVLIDYQSNGALVTLTSMNKSGNSTFSIIGFGNTINLPGPTASYLYPYVTYTRNFPWLINHTKSDPSNGCSSVSSMQNILIHNPYYTWPANCVISQQPQTQFVTSGTTAQFIIDAPDNVTKQWQQDAGLGFMNLTNAGPYSGVDSDTLSIANVQLSMNNFHYRCILSDSSGFGCHNTSSQAILYVSTTGLNEIFQIGLNLFPNPVSEMLNISGPIKFNKAFIKVYDLLGKEVISTQFEQDKGLDVSNLNNGMYFMELKQDNYLGRSTFVMNKNIR